MKGNGNMLTSSYTLTISMISVVSVSNSVLVNPGLGFWLSWSEYAGGGCLTGVIFPTGGYFMLGIRAGVCLSGARWQKGSLLC